MSLSIAVSTTYTASSSVVVKLPGDILSLTDMAGVFVKWDILHFRYKGKDYKIPLNSDPVEGIDWKRPYEIEFYAEDNNGDCDYSKPIKLGAKT